MRPTTVQATSALGKPSSPLSKLLPYLSQRFAAGLQTWVRAAASPGRGIVNDGAKNQVPGGKNLPSVEQCACPRCQLPHTGFYRNAPENSQIRAAVWFLTSHSRLPSPHRQLPASYVPLLRTSSTHFETFANFFD